jgi:hypothetical protein
MATDAQNAWIASVLGITLPTARSTPGRKPVDAQRLMTLWADAKDTVDTQISQLQTRFRDVEHPFGAVVADRGLPALTGKLLTGLQVALRNLAGAAPGDPGAAADLQGAIDALLGFLGTDAVLPLLENNPFGVQVTIRATLGNTLRTMRDAVAAP